MVKTTDIDAALTIINAMLDPATAKARLLELRAAAADLETKLAEERDLASKVAEDRAAAETAQSNADSTAKQTERELARRGKELDEGVARLGEHLTALTKQKNDFQILRDGTMADLSDREASVSAREKAASDRDAAHAEEAGKLGVLRSDLDARMSRLKELAA